MTQINLNRIQKNIIEMLQNDYGFNLILEKKYGSMSGIKILMNETLKVKTINERGRFYLEFGFKNTEFWIDLALLRYFIDKIKVNYMESIVIQDYLTFNFSKIQNIFSELENLKLLDQLKYNYANRLPL